MADGFKGAPPPISKLKSSESKSQPKNNDIGTKSGAEMDYLYEVPFWSHPPAHPYYLEVVKDGSVVQTINIHEKGHYLLGRAPICDIVVDNPTISRQHAVFQMRKTGECYIYDLGSTHKTFVNKIEVKPREYAKLKSGDLITFGLSKRLYYLQGGPEEDVPMISVPSKPKQKQDDSNFIQQLIQKRRDEKEEFSLRQLHDDDDDNDYDRDEQDYTMLKKTIDSLLDNEDDDYYDRTIGTKKKTQSIVENYKTLKPKKDMLEKIKNTLTLEINDLQKSIREQKEKEASEEYEDIDDFMKHSRHSIEEEMIKVKQWLLKDVNAELTRIDKMLSMVGSDKKRNESLKLTKQMKLHVVEFLKDYMKRYEETNIRKSKEKRKYTFEDFYDGLDKLESEEKEETEKVVENDRFKDYTVVKDELNYGPTKKMKKTTEVSDEPLKKIEPMAEIPQNIGRVMRKPKPIPTYKRDIVDDEEESQAQYESWVPPADQTGDGRTALNDKLGY